MHTHVATNRVIPGASYFVPGFRLDEPSNYSLRVLITPVLLVYAIENTASKEIVALQPFQFPKAAHEAEWGKLVNAVLDANEFLNTDFGIRKIGIFTPSMTLIPGQLYEATRVRDLLAFNTTINENDVVFSEEIEGYNIQLIYSIPSTFFSGINGKLQGAIVSHSYNSLIRFLIGITDHGKHWLYAYVQPNSFQLIYIREKSLRFFNSFHYQSPEDFIYYLLFACKQLHLEPEKLNLVLMGEIMRDSSIYQLAYKYFRNLEFIGPHPKWQFGNDYPLPGHFFFNLFCL